MWGRSWGKYCYHCDKCKLLKYSSTLIEHIPFHNIITIESVDGHMIDSNLYVEKIIRLVCPNTSKYDDLEKLFLDK